MPLTADELIEKAVDQRKRHRYEEALVSSIAATEADPNSANAWWQVSLNRLELGDTNNAIFPLRKTVDLSPGFSIGWARLGSVLLKISEEDSAREAFEKALEEDPNNEEALEALAKFYSDQWSNDPASCDKEFSILTRLEKVAGLSYLQSNRIANLHQFKGNYFESIKRHQQNIPFWHSYVTLYNLGLVYNMPEVSQRADAVDAWRLATNRFPNDGNALKRTAEILPKLLKLARNVRSQGKTLLSEDQWYSHYLNPFELLNPSNDLDLEHFNAKTIQRLKKVLLHEIDLEDGVVSWMPGVTIDKSKAIGVCEKLDDEEKRRFHWYVFQNKSLLAFLSKGSHEHFLVDENESQLETIEFLIENDGNCFRDWLSEPFATQYDLVLSRAINKKNVVVLECLLDGRRWVSPSYADRCFENSRRLVDRLLGNLREANKKADDIKPTVASVTGLLNPLLGILNLLPTYFRDYQDEAVSNVRGIAISCVNSHANNDIAKEILDLTNMFLFKSANLIEKLDEDFKTVAENIRIERQNEVKLTSGSDKWEVTKEGAVLGQRYIVAADSSAIRWGSIVRREAGGTVYDFLLAVIDIKGQVIQFWWNTTTDIDAQQAYFNKFIDAAMSYLFPAIIDRITERLDAGHSVVIGPCRVTAEGIYFETKSWILTSQNLVPWNRARATLENGEMIISDITSPQTRISFSFRDTENAPVLRFLVLSKKS